LLPTFNRIALKAGGYMSNTLKDQLVERIEELPDDRVSEVLSFVEHLLRSDQSAMTNKPVDKLDMSEDPILKFNGGVSIGSLAQAIDNELYGE
jgi:hypothetical protein